MKTTGATDVPNTILEAIKEGVWDFEPDSVEEELFESTQALPGTVEKLEVLEARVRKGLPLWHPRDRRAYDETNID